MCSNRCAKPVRFLRLDAEADAVHHFDDDDRRRVVFADDHAQAVRQLLVDDRNLEGGAGRGLRAGRGHRHRSQTEHEQTLTHKLRL